MTDFYIQVPADVKVLLLTGTSLNKNQLDQVQKCTNLLKLDLSNCNLTLIPNIKRLTNLRILYLHQNQISQLSIEPISGCNNLNYLTLFLNPVSAQCSLRRQVISQVKSLWAFDFNAITDEEKHKELRLQQSTEKSRLPWPIISTPKEFKDQSQIVFAVERTRSDQKNLAKMFCHFDYLTQYQMFLTRKIQKLFRNKQKYSKFYFIFRAFVRQAVKHWIRFTRNKKTLINFQHINTVPNLRRLKFWFKIIDKEKERRLKNKRVLGSFTDP